MLLSSLQLTSGEEVRKQADIYTPPHTPQMRGESGQEPEKN